MKAHRIVNLRLAEHSCHAQTDEVFDLDCDTRVVNTIQQPLKMNDNNYNAGDRPLVTSPPDETQAFDGGLLDLGDFLFHPR